MTHPDAEDLARYAEGRLPASGAPAVEEHLAVCPDCRDVVVDAAAAYVADDARLPVAATTPVTTVVPFRRRKLMVALTAGLAAAAAIVLAVRATREPSVSDSFDALVAAVDQEPTRALEGRLTGFRYAPAATVTRGDARTEIRPDLQIAAATVEQAAAGRSDAASAAATGVAHAVVGELDEAIADLKRAAAGGANRAQALGDLSALYLARGRRDSRSADYQAAVAAADRALAIDASSPGACFNRALALEALARRGDAHAAWERCLTLEHDGGWAAEIRARLTASQ